MQNRVINQNARNSIERNIMNIGIKYMFGRYFMNYIVALRRIIPRDIELLKQNKKHKNISNPTPAAATVPQAFSTIEIPISPKNARIAITIIVYTIHFVQALNKQI